jgi:glutaredoxin
MNELSYYMKIISLDGCPYSIHANNLLEIHNIPFKKVIVNYDTKDNYKSVDIQTFPQIYLKKLGSKSNLLLGGYDDLKYSIDLFKGQKYDDNNIINFMNKYKWSKKATLRLIQLLN